MRSMLVALTVAGLLAAACSGGRSTAFSVTGATADATYWCPGNVRDKPYDLHATVNVHNGRSSAVTITNVTAAMTLADVDGKWLERPGETYDAGEAKFTPVTVAPGANGAVAITIQSACTSPAYGSADSAYGDYRITMRLTTTAGTYSVTASNLHRILAA